MEGSKIEGLLYAGLQTWFTTLSLLTSEPSLSSQASSSSGTGWSWLSSVALETRLSRRSR